MESTNGTRSEWRSDSIAKLAAALAAAQSKFGPINRSREVTVRTEKGTYKFSYAPLDEVLAATRPALTGNGLSLSQLLADGSLRTVLLHSSGEWIASEISLPPRPAKMQELGSILTYLRRYALVALLGVASEEDDDGNAGDGNHWEPAPRHAPPATKQPPAAAPKPAAIETQVEIQSGAGMPPDLKRVLAAIEKAQSIPALFETSDAAGALEESVRGIARDAFLKKQRQLKGGGS